MKRSTSSTEEASQTMKQKLSSRSASVANSSSSRSTSSENCAYCGSSNLHHRLVTRSFGKGDKLLVIEGIPSISCGNCGESYFTAATMHEIERVKAHRKALAVTRPVPVVAFA
jgi:YgiT-type zinc finger domain-containing protein